MNIEKYISRRISCPLCESNNITEGISPHINLKYPVLPVCVDEPIEEDDFFSFTIGICNQTDQEGQFC